jgi:putative spermidine/putrescine transport system ATP-binding protein
VPAELKNGVVVFRGEALPLLGAAQPDGPVTAMIRPEDISFAREGLAAVVVASSFLGSLRRTQVRLNDDTLLSIQHDVNEHPEVGDTVHLRFSGRPVSAAPRD